MHSVSMRGTLLFTMMLAASPAHSFLMMARQLAQSRLDPLVSPGVVSQHVHAVVGGSSFSQSYNSTVYKNANCTTIEIPADKSNYWSPAVYGKNQNGTYSALPITEVRVYYFNHNNATAFPDGLLMLAGNANSRDPAGNSTDGSDLALFTCQQGNYRAADGSNEVLMRGFPPYVCHDFLRASITFPNCWNGQDLDSSDHYSHMTYTGSSCPDTHPVAVPQITVEFGYLSNNYDPSSLILANGDVTGYGLHADFATGWDRNVLQSALDDPTCDDRENDFGNLAQCNALSSIADRSASLQCLLEGEIPQEPVAIPAPLPQLPGCNLDWSGNATKPVCSPARSDPPIGARTSFFDFNVAPIPVFNATATTVMKHRRRGRSDGFAPRKMMRAVPFGRKA